MDTFIKIFCESGAGGEQRLEDSINKFAIKRNLDIVDAKPCFSKGVLEDTMFVVVVFKRKATIADIKDVRLIVKEGVPSLISENLLSTVCIKVRYNDEWLGDYQNFNKPTLEVREVVDAANMIFGELIESLKEGRRHKSMRLKAKSKDDIIEELEDRNIELFKSYCDLKLHNFKLESQNKDLEQELSEVRERYADLLERYIKTMERMVRIDEQRAD